MVRQDIVAGLRNALERGASIESAKNSLLSAGYSMEDIQDATNFITSGSAISAEPQFVKAPADYVMPSKPSQPYQQQQPQQPQQSYSAQQPQQFQQFQQPQQSYQMPQQQFQQIPSRVNQNSGFFSRNWKIILLSCVLVIFIVLFILILIFKDEIAKIFF
jgi:hypothetical protein